MEEDRMSTATMTSVTAEDLSMDETDTSTQDVESSSQLTTSDCGEERNATVIHTPLSPSCSRREEAGVMDISMDGESEENIDTTVHKRDRQAPLTEPSEQPKHNPQKQNSGDSCPPGSSLQFPDLTSVQGKWYEQECFNHYWRHYHFVSMWCQKHMETYRAVMEQYSKEACQQRIPTSFSQSPFKKPTVSKKTLRNRKARRRVKAARKRAKAILKNAELAGSHSSLVSSSAEDAKKPEESEERKTTESVTEGVVGKAEDMDLEITDEMLDFFAHTHKHRQERDALKKNKEGEKEEKHINIEEREEKKERTETAPVERPGSKRTSEMRALYGKGAAMIHGMETALQMTFDRNIDVLQPSLWPNMPLRVIF